ncbi:hypothetical protein HUW63_35760 [Myxococcus sp. AM001]|nr:hypothetical protein [Myxococcus sp. AM001]
MPPFLGYLQLKGKVKAVFNDDRVRGGVDRFAQNVGLLGGVDYQNHFVEARVATADFFTSPLDPTALKTAGKSRNDRPALTYIKR